MLVRRVADRLDAAGADAGAAIDQWELEVRGAHGPIVLRPHDPTHANAWQVSVAGAPALAAAIGDRWRHTAAEPPINWPSIRSSTSPACSPDARRATQAMPC